DLMNSVLLELEIKIGVGEATGTPVLQSHNITRAGREFGTNSAAPRPIFKALMLPRCLLNGRDIFPDLVVSGTVPVMHRIEDRQSRFPCRSQDLQHMRNTLISFCHSFNAIPQLAPFGYEVIVRIDHQKCSELFFVCQTFHGLLKNYESQIRSN